MDHNIFQTAIETLTDNYISSVWVIVLVPIMWHAGFALKGIFGRRS